MDPHALIEAALIEDVGPGDFTTLWTVAEDATNRAAIVAKQQLTVSGIELARAVFGRTGPDLAVEVGVGDGEGADPGDVVMRIEGRTRGILTGERVALNFLGRLSGIATFTHRFVEAVAGTDAQVIDTRKTTPGWRALEKQAVSDGGGTNHRMGLHDMVMIKDNHIAAAGGPEHAVARVRHHNDIGIPVQVEVTSIHELTRVLPLGVDRILLDNMSLETLREAVRRVKAYGDRAPITEASGNVSLGTVRSIAETGVDQISVGALTHSAPVADLSLRIVG
jgi:nicotinate-nucleotide pyrophosphorylase (carboxylating)